MIKFSYQIKDQLGLHARPVSMLVKIMEKYNIKILIEKDDIAVEADHMLALMQMGIKKGDIIMIHTEGPDEEEAVEVIKEFFQDNL